MIDRCPPTFGRRSSWLLLPLSVAIACTPERNPWPDEEPDVLDVTLREGTIQTTPALANTAKVEPGRLVFPRSTDSDAAAAWEVGKPVFGGAAETGGSDNPFGFLRKVKSVNTDGENVVVETEEAGIQDVFTGTARLSVPLEEATPVDVDEETLARYFPEIPNGEGQPLPGAGQPLSPPDGFVQTAQPISGSVEASQVFDQTASFPFFQIRKAKTVGTGNKAVTVTIEGSGTISAQFVFKPTLILAFEAGLTSGLDYFNLEAKGPMKLTTAVDVNVGITAASGTDPARLVDLATLLAEGPETGQMPPIVLAQSKPMKGPVIYGIPTTFRLKLLADCGFGIQGSMNARLENTIEATRLEASLTYTDEDGWYTGKQFSFDKRAVASIGAGGGVAVECGVTARVDWLVADKGGGYLGVRGALKARAAYADRCNPAAPQNGRPDGVVQAGLDAKLQLQVGGEIDAWKVVDFEVGPYNVYEKQFKDLWSFNKEWPGRGLGYCIVDCGNGVKSGNETDVDCGANCLKCAQGKRCAANTDCQSGGCDPDGVCTSGPCDNRIRDQDESDTDCGGAACGGCQVGQRCERVTDCANGTCSRDLGGYRVCTLNLCLDGLKSGAEGDVDCGATEGCGGTLCTLGQGCNSGADCTTGACNIVTRLCVADQCVDGQLSPGETDVDCGPSCARKCPAGATCNALGPAGGGPGCESGACNARTWKCVGSPCENERADGAETDVDCGGDTCGRCGINASCGNDSDCASGALCHRRTQRCVRPGCDDGVKNGEESAVDCGGSTCAKCGISKACNVDNDCVSSSCFSGRCVGGPCENEVKDTAETDVDCGGVCGGIRCATGKACLVAGDCKSNICANNVCTSDPCLDRVRNGAETDVDCGGDSCATRCGPGLACSSGTDCASGRCNATTGRCVADQCSDGAKNGNEADVDCGGSCAAKCVVNKSCGTDGDCASGVCNATTNRCVPDRCFDGVKNGNETDLDCGGSCSPKCRAGASCLVGRDCQGGACIPGTNTCAADQCSDTTLNGDESSVDCGGSCSLRCSVGAGCRSGNDCVHPQGLVGVPGYCNITSRTCTATSCGDGVKSGDETGVDCGGSCAAACAIGEGCLTGANCTSGFCNASTRRCVASRCEDGVRNGTESDVDCGNTTLGSNTGCAFPCALSKACSYPWDCASGYCGTSGLCVPTVPNSCAEIYNRNGPGDRSSGVKELDPDGPVRLTADARDYSRTVTGNLPPAGWDDSILMYCDMSRDGGGWTPAAYINSQGSPGRPDAGAGLNYSDWMYQGPCTQNSDCRNNGRCVPYAPSGRSFCISAAPLDASAAANHNFGLFGPPENYTARTQRGYGTTITGLAWPGKPGYNGDNAGLHSPGDRYNISTFRWEAYRNGSRVYSSGPIQHAQRMRWDGSGQVRIGMYSGEYQWTQATQAYMNSLSVPEDGGCSGCGYQYGFDSDPNGNPALNFRARGFGFWRTYGQNFDVGQVLFRFFPGGFFTAGGPGPTIGLWTATYGYNSNSGSYSSFPFLPRYGLCNTFNRTTNCSVVRHPNGEFTANWNSTELTDPNSGSELVYGTPGLVFVLWVR